MAGVSVLYSHGSKSYRKERRGQKIHTDAFPHARTTTAHDNLLAHSYGRNLIFSFFSGCFLALTGAGHKINGQRA